MTMRSWGREPDEGVEDGPHWFEPGALNKVVMVAVERASYMAPLEATTEDP